jgi:hypothetical protein
MTAPKTYDDIMATQSFRLLRKALVREYIARKPTLRQSHALDLAALYSERARLAATDPNMSPDQQVKLVAAARHARRLLAEISAEREERLSGPPYGVLEMAS